MQITTFPSDDHYRRAQHKTAKRRSSERGYYHKDEIRKIVDWVDYQVPQWRLTELYGVCHGANSGREATEFEQVLGNSLFLATDLFPKLGPHKVIEHDFRRAVLEWEGAFDIVYSNSLDHSNEPQETLRVWSNQLKPNGFMFVEWTYSHRETKGGDCFGASLDEYMMLLEEAGQVRGLIYVGDSTVVLAASRKDS